jgi:uncharacterized protein (DUF983 family)
MVFSQNSKLCSKCKEWKLFADYNKSVKSPGGVQSRCRECIKHYTKKGYQTLEMTHKVRHRYMSDWANFFEQEYGNNPQCSVCNTPLSYHRDDELPTVVFDHRVGNELIQGSPSAFCRTHPRNDEHVATWKSCDFGILCRQCNAALPTQGRQEWLDRVIEYMSEVSQ